MNDTQTRSESSPARSAFWPLLILGIATTAWNGFQAFQLGQEHEALKKHLANQETLVQNAVKMRAQLDAIAADTQRLANSGNTGAQTLVTELRRRGVTISVDAVPASEVQPKK